MQESYNIKNSLHMVKVGKNFLGILNDIKRRPEDAAKELGVPLEQIQAIIEGKKYKKLIKSGDLIYIKPFVKHSFSGNGKLVVLRVGGRIPGDSQRELSIIGKQNAERAINETMQWFNPEGKN